MYKYIKSNTYIHTYKYFTKHGIGPGTLPKDVKLLDWSDVDDNITAIWLDRFLTTRELKEYDIYPETSDHHKMYSKKLNNYTVTASRSDSSYQHYYAYKYKGTKNRFSIHYDDVTDIDDPELSFKQFRASVSPIKPYDDADYAWATIEHGSISYYRKGKLIKREFYFMFSDYGTDYEDMYENANEWITDLIDSICDTLIELNQNVEPRIIHNSTSIQSSDENKLSSEFIDSYRIAKAQFEKDYTDSYVALNRHKDDSDRVDIIVHVKDDYGIAHEGYINVNINECDSDELFDRFNKAANILLHKDSVTAANKGVTVVSNTYNEYLRMKRQYKNRKSFKDRETESGNIQDLIDDLKNKGVSYEIYEDKTDDGCTIFFDETDSVYSSSDYNDDSDLEADWAWEILDTKRVLDSDGFYTDYTLYTNENEDIYICMLGNRNLYGPDIDYADYETDDENAAWEWFDNYKGFADDYVYSSEGLKSSDFSDETFEDDNEEYDEASLSSSDFMSWYDSLSEEDQWDR